MIEKDIKFYKKNGWMIVRNFFNKKYLKNIKREILKKTKNKNKNFYFERIKNKLKLRRIEKVTDFSKNAKNLICAKKTQKLFEKLEGKKLILFKDKLNFKFPGGKGYLPHIDGHFYWRDDKKKYQKLTVPMLYDITLWSYGSLGILAGFVLSPPPSNILRD